MKNMVNVEGEKENLPENESIKTRNFYDSSYERIDFSKMGYILKKVNHSVWFEYGLFHTNKVESLWRKIKPYSDNFIGFSIENLKTNLTIIMSE